ncbi:hypothetical protein ACLOJK_011580 [Asimina triloba]
MDLYHFHVLMPQLALCESYCGFPSVFESALSKCIGVCVPPGSNCRKEAAILAQPILKRHLLLLNLLPRQYISGVGNERIDRKERRQCHASRTSDGVYHQMTSVQQSAGSADSCTSWAPTLCTTIILAHLNRSFDLTLLKGKDNRHPSRANMDLPCERK